MPHSHIQASCFRDHVTSKLNLTCNYPATCFTLSLTITEITVNLSFQGQVTLRCRVTSKPKISKVLTSQGSTICSVSLYLLWFPRKQSIYISKVKWHDLKSCNFVCSNPINVEKYFHFFLSLMVSEITTNLLFRGQVTMRGHVSSNWNIQKL